MTPESAFAIHADGATFLGMRRTVTLDPDVERIVRARMAQRGVSFEQALNDAIRQGAVDRLPADGFSTRVHSLGTPARSLDGALSLAADLEDDELERVADDHAV
ncbi:MAG: hypothetical protein U0Q19_21610 [Kineosporiaceae bacterium]